MSLIAIVGMGPGISEGVARRFGREGFSVAMFARSQQKLDAHAAALNGEGIQARGYTADAADFESLTRAFAAMRADLGEADALLYNAAALRSVPALEQSPEDMVADFRVNVAAALHAAQLVLPHMQRQGRGSVLLTGGGLALYPSPAYTSLSVGKAGLRALAFALAKAVADDGVHVATVTVQGFVQPNDPKHNPDAIAEQFWALHTEPAGAFTTEIQY